MRNLLLTLGLLLAVAAAAGYCVYRSTCGETAVCVAREGDALRWLKAEFHLSDAQYATVLKLHEAQSERCAAHCAAVGAAKDRLRMARKAGDAQAVAAATGEVRRTEETCERSVEAHVRAVAAQMPAGEGARYLALVLPKISAMAHSGPPDVRLDP